MKICETYIYIYVCFMYIYIYFLYIYIYIYVQDIRWIEQKIARKTRPLETDKDTKHREH